MSKELKAYIDATDTHHLICSNCEDSAEVVKVAESLETKLAIKNASIYIDYIKRQILFTLCDPCITKKEHHA